MKKFIFVVAVLLLVSIPAFCFADTNITESFDIKMIINGKNTAFNDPVIVQNGRTMLPLRELFTSLGVQNDDQHILWNANEKSVVVLKGTKKVFLKIGSNTANINDAEVTLDAAPVVYAKNGRTYIPVRFVAQALGKKVAWDEYTKSVLICEENNYNAVSEILVKSYDAMSALKRYKCDKSINSISSYAGESITNDISASVQIDQENKITLNNVIMKTSMQTSDKTTTQTTTSVQNWITGNNEYVKTGDEGKWYKTELLKTDYKLFFETFSFLKPNDVLCTGLQVVENSNANEIKLSGDIVLSELLKLSGQIVADVQYSYKSAKLDVWIDKSTNCITEFSLMFDADVAATGFTAQQQAKMDFVNSDFNGDFELKLPDETKDAKPFNINLNF